MPRHKTLHSPRVWQLERKGCPWPSSLLHCARWAGLVLHLLTIWHSSSLGSQEYFHLQCLWCHSTKHFLQTRSCWAATPVGSAALCDASPMGLSPPSLGRRVSQCLCQGLHSAGVVHSDACPYLFLWSQIWSLVTGLAHLQLPFGSVPAQSPG